MSIGLLSHLKQLSKAKKIQKQQQQLKKRQKQLQKLKNQKLNKVNFGLFAGLSFCFPILKSPQKCELSHSQNIRPDKKNNIQKQQFDKVQNLQGLVIKKLQDQILLQGGQVIKFYQFMPYRVTNYLLVSEKINIQRLQLYVHDKIRYDYILNYKFIEESLIKFTRMNMQDYKLADYPIISESQSQQSHSHNQNQKTKKKSKKNKIKKHRKKMRKQRKRLRLLKRFIQFPNYVMGQQISNQKQQNYNNESLQKIQKLFNQEDIEEKDVSQSQSSSSFISEQGQKNKHKTNKHQKKKKKKEKKKKKKGSSSCQDYQIRDSMNQSQQQKNYLINENFISNEKQGSQANSENQSDHTNQLETQQCKLSQSIQIEKINPLQSNYLVKQQNKKQIIQQHQQMQAKIAKIKQQKSQKKAYNRQNNNQQFSLQKYIRFHQQAEKTNISQSNLKTAKPQRIPISQNKFPNSQRICNQLLKMQKIYKNNGDSRFLAYTKAVYIIKGYGKQIKSNSDIEQLKIGQKMKSKIKQILLHGVCQDIEKHQNQQNDQVYNQFNKIWGIGPSKAKQLYRKGIKSVQELENHQQLLTRHQQIGLKYRKQFQKRIPRQKVSRMFEYIKKIFYNLVGTQKCHKLQVAGSYRRGKQTCGDIDLLITRMDGTVQRSILIDYVNQLERREFITEHLSIPKTFQGHGSVLYMGVCKFQDQTHHRIDIKYYPVDQYAFALLYFTGSELFNRQMRMDALSKGLLLSDHNIRKRVMNGKYKVFEGKIPICLTEQDIFKFMNLKYKTPEERDT